MIDDKRLDIIEAYNSCGDVELARDIVFYAEMRKLSDNVKHSQDTSVDLREFNDRFVIL